MARLFWTDSITFVCTSVEATKRWWTDVFGCKPVPVPPEWGAPLPSAVALKLPGEEEPTILLNSRAEITPSLLDRPDPVPIIFCSNLEKARVQLASRGVLAGPIQDGGDTQFFEIRDPDGNLIEICTEP